MVHFPRLVGSKYPIVLNCILHKNCKHSEITWVPPFKHTPWYKALKWSPILEKSKSFWNDLKVHTVVKMESGPTKVWTNGPLYTKHPWPVQKQRSGLKSVCLFNLLPQDGANSIKKQYSLDRKIKSKLSVEPS